MDTADPRVWVKELSNLGWQKVKLTVWRAAVWVLVPRSLSCMEGSNRHAFSRSHSSGVTMIGTRREDLICEDDYYKLNPAEYMRVGDPWSSKEPAVWYARTPPNRSFPDGAIANLRFHEVVEHEDGTITVSPSILVTGRGSWHGYLVRGVWTEA